MMYGIAFHPLYLAAEGSVGSVSFVTVGSAISLLVRSDLGNYFVEREVGVMKIGCGDL